VRIGRILWFFISILFGVALGLLYGWVINPGAEIQAPASTLRADYRTDTVLMVAEIYAARQDSTQSIEQLKLLGEDEPLHIVQQAILTAQDLNYPAEDVSLLANLAQALSLNAAQTLGTAAP
jgi:Na+/H+-dicarboxylate symporter